jgi:hypothetical protein
VHEQRCADNKEKPGQSGRAGYEANEVGPPYRLPGSAGVTRVTPDAGPWRGPVAPHSGHGEVPSLRPGRPVTLGLVLDTVVRVEKCGLWLIEGTMRFFQLSRQT